MGVLCEGADVDGLVRGSEVERAGAARAYGCLMLMAARVSDGWT